MVNIMKRRKNGFTFAEMVGVVVVLGLLAAIVTPVVTKLIKNKRNDLYEQQIKSIEESARVWGAENISKLPDDGDGKITITLGELKRGGFADKDLTNPKNDQLFDDDKTIVIISNENGTIKYTVVVE